MVGVLFIVWLCLGPAFGEIFGLGPKNILTLIEENGYLGESHTIVTEDGYILTTHRICKQICNNKTPVFLQHGVYNTAEHFLILGPERGLGYILADNGYDVWLGNSRGTKFSRKHKTLNPNFDAQFWKFSFHEMGYYDLPANVDYILKTTKREQLYYVGHSQATSSFYVMGSTRPEYNKKIKAQFSLSCVAHMKDLDNPIYNTLAKILPLEDFVEMFLQKFPMFYDLRTPLVLTSLFGKIFCSDDSPTQLLCKDLMVQFSGFSHQELNASTIPTIFSYTPSECSWRQVTHYLQLIRTGIFRPYDYGKSKNLQLYGAELPPPYDLGKITAPIYLFLGGHDFFANLTIVEAETVPRLGNLQGQYIMPYHTFAHNDFMNGIDLPTLVFNRILCILEAYETNTPVNCE